LTPSYDILAPEPAATVWVIVKVHYPIRFAVIGLKVKVVPSKAIQALSRTAPPFCTAVRVEVVGQVAPQALIAGEAILLASFTVPNGAVTVLGLLVLLTSIV